MMATINTALRYTILAGDTLSGIAAGLHAAAGVYAQSIVLANPGINPSALEIGAILNIPAKIGGGTVLRYTVLAGDTYTAIAAGLSACASINWQEIERANPGLNPNALGVGQVIAIPQPGCIAPSAPELDVQVTGWWRWTWSSSATPPTGANLGIAFSGWSDPATALAQSAHVKNSLPGSRYIALGGGNDNGKWSSTSLSKITSAITAGQFAGYDGIAYDVEEGDSGLAALFQQSFAAAKAHGFKVLVTVSHSAPFGIADAAQLMEYFFVDANIDIISPQLYTSGKETSNDYAISQGVTWPQYAAVRAAIVPSIVSADLYPSAQSYFFTQDVILAGFIQWQQ